VAVPTSENELSRTPAGIPSSLRPFFQEYVLEELDPERNAFTVIERTLAWGDVAELTWLFATYDWERVAEWVRRSGWYLLPRRRFQYWRHFFGLTDYQHGERIWAH
jgi:Family of unknown function (DUF6922)